jgi:hypothetical protein
MVKTALTISMNARPLPQRPRSFGRRRPFAQAIAAPAPTLLGDNLKLFATTYAAGFLFVIVFLA